MPAVRSTKLLVKGLTDAAAGGFAKECWDNLAATARLAAQRLETAFAEAGGKSPPPGKWQLELIESAFYRARGAYYVGCLARDTEPTVHLPIALCLRHPSETESLSMPSCTERTIWPCCSPIPGPIFGSTPVSAPIGPLSRSNRCRASVGSIFTTRLDFNRHGKTEFYRDFVAIFAIQPTSSRPPKARRDGDAGVYAPRATTSSSS